MSAVWLKDVANAAGVSVSTASHAVNGTGSIGKKARERVLKLAKEMGYQKSPYLSAIASRRFRGEAKYVPVAYMAFAGPDGGMSHAPFAHKIPLEQAAAPLGFRIVECVNFTTLADAAKFLDKAYHCGVEGILIGHADQLELVMGLDFSRFSVLCVGDVPARAPFHRIEWDWADATRAATRKLIAAGCRRIGAILPSQKKSSLDDRQRLGAFLSETAGLNFVPPYLDLTNEGLLEWYRTHRPDGLVSFGVPTLYYLREREIRFPEEIPATVISLSQPSVPSVNKTDWNDPFAGNLRREQELASHAMRMLCDLVTHHEKGPATPPVNHFIRMTWKDGPSLGAT